MLYLGRQYEHSLRCIRGFALVGAAWFFLMMIGLLTYDYGTTIFFIWLPLQIALPHYESHFTSTYVLGGLLPIVATLVQLFLVRRYDEEYAKRKADGEGHQD